VYEIQLSEYFDKIFNHFDFRRATEWRDTPYADNLSSKILWGRQSKALERSISTVAMY
jgi:hypothetical protein